MCGDRLTVALGWVARADGLAVVRDGVGAVVRVGAGVVGDTVGVRDAVGAGVGFEVGGVVAGADGVGEDAMTRTQRRVACAVAPWMALSPVVPTVIRNVRVSALSPGSQDSGTPGVASAPVARVSSGPV